MLLTGSLSTRLPGVNEHLSSSAIPAVELKLTLMRKRRLENPMKTAAKRAKGGSRSPPMEDFDDGDDDSIKTTSSKDGDDTEGCVQSVKALIERYTTDDVPCYLCGTIGCQGHSPAQVRDKLFARRTRAKRLKELRNQCIQEVQRQRESGKHQMQQQRYHRQRPVTKRMPSDPDNNIRRRTEDGILTLVQMFDKVKPDMSSVHKQKVHYNVRIQVTKMVEDVLKEYKTKIELQFQNTYRKQAKNQSLYQQKQQSSYHSSQVPHQTYHQAVPGRMAYNQSQMQHQQQAMPYPHATRMSMYQRTASSSPPLPQRNFRQKNAPFTNTPSPSMSPETQTQQPSPPYVEANKRRARSKRDTKPIIPMLSNSRPNQETSRHSAPPTATCVRENSHEVERSYPVLPLGMDAGKPQSNRFTDIDFVSLDPPGKNNASKNDGSRLDVWGSSPLPLPPSNAQTEANLMAHNVHGENNDLLMSSFEVQNGRDLLKN